jgi:phospholipid-translocating ATPase
MDWRLYRLIADAWYLNANHSAPVRDVLQDVFSFLVVFNYIIPISLYVTLGKVSL